MKKIKSLLLVAIACAVFSCDDFLDINSKNPNQATSSTPQQTLPNALVVTAANIVTYHDYGAWHAGYIANAGGYGGWGATITYNYTTNDYANLWSITFDNLEDYQYIINETDDDATMVNFNAAARIMKVFNYQLLVDTYGNVPYSEALQGAENVTPAYDNAVNIYEDLVVQLNTAITAINGATSNAFALGSSDVLFKADMAKWKAFANTLKLRILLRASSAPVVPNWVASGFDSFGANTAFLTTDAIVNPGYSATAGKQNPMWEMYHSNSAGTTAGAGRSRIPTDFILTYYKTKIDDQARGDVTFRGFSSTTAPTPHNQLGFQDPDVDEAPSGNPSWYVGSGSGTESANTIGILKGRAMGQPIMLAAESYFLQAEALLKTHLDGSAVATSAQEAYTLGIQASFSYLYKDVSNTVTGDPAGDAADYIAANVGNDLVDWDAADSEPEKVEAIITQKYIALNFIHGHEAWNEFRRTAYPSISGTSATTTFASTVSTSNRADRLPVRVLYPASEYQVNSANAPQEIGVFTSNIFWDAN